MDTEVDPATVPGTVEYEERKAASIAQGMADAGVNPEESVQEDYWGTDETYKVFLPDGKSYMECKYLSDGDRRKYQKAISRDVRLNKASGDAILQMTVGEEKVALILGAVVDWNLVRKDKKTGQLIPVPFSGGTKGSNLSQWIDVTRPQNVDHVFNEIAKNETWLNADVTVEAIDEQIADLEKLKAELIKEAEGKEA